LRIRFYVVDKRSSFDTAKTLSGLSAGGCAAVQQRSLAAVAGGQDTIGRWSTELRYFLEARGRLNEKAPAEAGA
jgi:hypothetical protein